MVRITLRSARINVGLSREFVAKSVGVSLSTIKNWENGITFPTQPQIEKLCALYGVTYDVLNFCPKN